MCDSWHDSCISLSPLTTIHSFSEINSHGAPLEGSDFSTNQLGWVWLDLRVKSNIG